MLAIILGIVILGLAAGILALRLRSFIRTRGQSACANCPYSGTCSGSCGKRIS